MEKIQQLLIIDDDKASRRLMVEVAKEIIHVKKIITCSTAFRALIHIRENCMPTVD